MKTKTLLQLLFLLGEFVSMALTVFVMLGLTKAHLITKVVARNKTFMIILFSMIYYIWCKAMVAILDRFKKK